MLMAVNLSQELYEYYEGYNLDDVVNTLLETYDVTNLPPVIGGRYKEVKVEVTNEYYISLYNTFGPRSKKVSLGRLLNFGYMSDVLRSPQFEIYKKDDTKASPLVPLLTKAYKALLDARKYDDSQELRDIISVVYAYKEAKRECLT